MKTILVYPVYKRYLGFETWFCYTAPTLSLLKTNQSKVVTNPQNGFEVECLVLSRSSDRSVFEVIWSRNQVTADREETQMVFNASRDGTLHILDGTEGGQMFARPTPTHFSLTFPMVGPSDVGSYSCHVSEWLLMTGERWRKLDSESSGQLTISLQTEGRNRHKHYDITTGMKKYVCNMFDT